MHRDSHERGIPVVGAPKTIDNDLGATAFTFGFDSAVAQELSQRLHRDVRTVVLGHLQRGGEPTPFDRVLATQFGAHAVRLIHQGHLGQMVCYRPPQIESVPIADAIRQLSRVDPDSSAVQAARALGIGFGDCAELASPFAAAAAAAPVRAARKNRARTAKPRAVTVRPR